MPSTLVFLLRSGGCHRPLSKYNRSVQSCPFSSCFSFTRHHIGDVSSDQAFSSPFAYSPIGFAQRFFPRIVGCHESSESEPRHPSPIRKPENCFFPPYLTYSNFHSLFYRNHCFPLFVVPQSYSPPFRFPDGSSLDRLCSLPSFPLFTRSSPLSPFASIFGVPFLPLHFFSLLEPRLLVLQIHTVL